MKVEVLYPELCTLYGDTGNIRYLKNCVPDARFTATRLGDDDCFTGDLIYMGPTTERGQELIAQELIRNREKFASALDAGKHFLFTGNALELCGEYIQDKDKRIPCLGVFTYHAVRDMDHRHNSLYIGRFTPEGGKSMDIVGFRSQFSFCEGDFFATWMETKRGVGLFGDTARGGGVHIGNFFGTYLLGPILPLNPDLTAYLLESLGCGGSVAFETEARKAYDKRIEEFWTADGPKH